MPDADQWEDSSFIYSQLTTVGFDETKYQREFSYRVFGIVKWGLESFPGRDLSFRTAVQIKYSRIKDVPGLDVVKTNNNNFIN